VRVVVGRLGRAHGVRGDIAVDVRTDEPDRRFAAESRLFTDSVDHPVVVVQWARWHSGRLLVHLDGVDDRTAAEALRGALLEAEVADDETPDDADEYYDRHLIGLAVVTNAGDPVGTVREVVHLPGHDLLAVTRPDAPEVLIPFVTEFVPKVELRAGRITIAPPDGLLTDADVAVD